MKLQLSHTPAPAHTARQLTRPMNHRVTFIVDQLLAGAHPNCSTLARELEVDRKTIQRDLDHLRDVMHYPIEFDHNENGYYFTRPIQDIGGLKFTEPELFALFVARNATAQYQGTTVEGPIPAAFRKLTDILNTTDRYIINAADQAISFRPLAPETLSVKTFETVCRAINHRRALRFEYRKPGVDLTEPREVHPYHLVCGDNCWYLLGHDMGRNAIRKFALSRIRNAAATAARFQRPPDFDPKAHLSSGLSVMTGSKDYHVIIELDAWAADISHCRTLHPTQRIVQLPGGGCRITLRLSCLEEIERWVLGWGTHANVIAPDTLRSRIHSAAVDLLTRYRAETEDLAA